MGAFIQKTNHTLLVIALSAALFSTPALCEDAKVVHLTMLHLNDVYEMEPVEN